MNPNSGDFEHWARKFVEALETVDLDSEDQRELTEDAIILQLRLVWNARGARVRLDARWREGLDLAPATRDIRSLDVVAGTREVL
jgi:hypothetical protein